MPSEDPVLIAFQAGLDAINDIEACCGGHHKQIEKFITTLKAMGYTEDGEEYKVRKA